MTETKGESMDKPMTSRQKRAAEMRERIQTNAMVLFDKNGFDSVSIEDIARASGCSVGNIYHYFKTKEELSLRDTALIDSLYEKLAVNLSAEASLSSGERLIEFVGRSLVMCINDEMLYKWFVHSIRYPEQSTLKVTEKRTLYRVLDRFISEAKLDGVIDGAFPTEDLIEYFIILQRGILLQWRVYGQSFDIVARGRGMTKALLDGRRPRP